LTQVCRVQPSKSQDLPKVLKKYLDCPRAAAEAPPPVVFNREGKRSYSKTSPQAAWQEMQNARKAHVSLRQALILAKSREEFHRAAVACSEFEDARWIRKELLMYYDLMCMPFLSRGAQGSSINQVSST